jgi:hypothetical protein
MPNTDSDTPSGTLDANQELSGGSAKPNSIDTAKIAAEVVAILRPELDEIKKASQSTKDKRIAEIQRTQEQVSKILGITPENAKEIGLFNQVKVEPEPVPTTPSGKEDAVGATVESLLSNAGIKDDDPDKIAFGQKTFANENEKLVEAANILARRLNPTVVTPAAVASPRGASIPPADLREEYQKELKAIPRGQRDAVFKLQLKYREKGLNV